MSFPFERVDIFFVFFGDVLFFLSFFESCFSLDRVDFLVSDLSFFAGESLVFSSLDGVEFDVDALWTQVTETSRTRHVLTVTALERD